MSDPSRETPERDLDRLLAELEPDLLPGEFIFVDARDLDGSEPEIYASVKEPEGLSVVISRDDADRLGLTYDFVAAWIVLRVHSALDAVGLTAEVSRRLAEASISCNVIAGLRHDHLLVPVEHAARAVSLLDSDA